MLVILPLCCNNGQKSHLTLVHLFVNLLHGCFAADGALLFGSLALTRISFKFLGFLEPNVILVSANDLVA